MLVGSGGEKWYESPKAGYWGRAGGDWSALSVGVEKCRFLAVLAGDSQVFICSCEMN